MSKRLLLGLIGAGAIAAVTVLPKKDQLSSEERRKVEQSKKYLEEKGYVVVEKSKYSVGKFNILSLSLILTFSISNLHYFVYMYTIFSFKPPIELFIYFFLSCIFKLL